MKLFKCGSTRIPIEFPAFIKVKTVPIRSGVAFSLAIIAVVLVVIPCGIPTRVTKATIGIQTA